MKKINKIISVFLMTAVAFVSFGCNKDAPVDGSTPVPPPVVEEISPVAFSPVAGEVDKDSTVTLSTSTEGADIYYLVVKGDDTATLTKDNYKTAGKYAEPIAITEAVKIYALAAKGENISEITSAAYTIKVVAPVVPEDAMRKWTAESTATAWSIYNYEDLVKLAEIVNGGKDLAGVTITQKEDITINASVLGDGFEEPAEAEACKPNANLINFAGIGSRKIPFAGTYDGNNKVISGLYIYGDHQGLGFFGCIKNATIKNVTIVDSCVINSNESADGDGSDDDRFGGLIGMTIETSEDAPLTDSIENCIFVGTLGSQAAKNRGGSYEYIAGMIGQVNKYTTVSLKNCYSLVKLNGTSVAALVKSVKGTAQFDDCYGVSLDKNVYTDASTKVTLDAEDGIAKATIIEAVKTACKIDLTDYFTKAGL